MALNKITYDNKVALNPQPSVANANKCTDRAEIRRIGNLVQVKGNLMANSNLSDNQSVSIPSASLSQFFTTEMEISGITNNSNWWIDTNGVFHISSSASSYININSCYMWTNN